MSKITFRADDDLIAQLEEFDASKSEIMREALREYLGETSPSDSDSNRSYDESSLDSAVSERVDDILADRLDETHSTSDINVNISLTSDVADVDPADVNVNSEPAGQPSGEESGAPTSRMTDPTDEEDTTDTRPNTCSQCGETLSSSHVYCPNCGEKSSHRVFCDCGDELRSDWAFCPSCGRRTPAADVLDQS